jgi:hypothetical protein
VRRPQLPPISARLGDSGSLTITFRPVVARGREADGPRIELAADDWHALLDGAVTATDLWFAGRLRLAFVDSWRADYARFFTALRAARCRMVEPMSRNVECE